jgi:outer membrane lipoprotein-sorting protein
MRIRIPTFHHNAPTARQRLGLRRQAQRAAALERSRGICTALRKAVSLPPHSKTTSAFDSFQRIRPFFHRRQLLTSSEKLARIVQARVCCLWILLCLTASVAHAAGSDAQFNKWFEVQTNLQSWSADFTQTRTLKVLSQPLVSPGKVWVTPGGFRWELGQPVQTIVLRQPDQLLIIYPRLKQAEKYPLGAVPTGPIKDALALLDASLPRDRATMEKNFRLLSATATNSILQMTLQPRSDSARKFIGEIVIGFHTNDFTIAATEMKFADGSSLRNDFANVVLNRTIDPAMFEARLPPDYTVVEPLKQ